MIAPMKKFLLVILDKDLHSAPQQLKKLGILHMQKFASSGESCAALETALKNAQMANGILSSNADKKSKAAPNPGAGAAELVSAALEAQAELSLAQDRLAELRRESDRIRGWGDFSPELLTELSGSACRMRLIECQPKQLNGLDKDQEFIRLPSPKGKARALFLGEGLLPAGIEEFRLPTQSLSQLEKDSSACEETIAKVKDSLKRFAVDRLVIDREIRRIESSLVLERLRAGMPQDNTLRYFSGYVPAKETDALKAEASKRGWAVAVDDPSAEDLPPTKVENNAVVRIIQPVFDFLGTVPNYREYDTSAWFLGFFTLYFAMIFGDGGYGLILLFGALAMLLNSRKQKKPLSDFGRLLFVLSGMTILWGFLTATWFAIPFEALPSILRTLSLPALNGGNPESGTNTKIFCFIVGAVQLSIAHMKNIKRDFPHPKFLSQIGSLAMVIGMLNAVLNLVIDASRFPLQGWALGLIGGGFILVFIFGNWNGNLLTAILDGLKGIIPTFLGMVSVFADIVSYIRLWAVGLAGLAISQTVNGMAVNMLGPAGGRIAAFLIGGVMALVLILVGHSINLMMSVLSVIVHGIRLNILEFSSHLGMEWSGYKYEPLSESAEERKSQESTL